jgi:hypothetical protein
MGKVQTSDSAKNKLRVAVAKMMGDARPISDWRVGRVQGSVQTTAGRIKGAVKHK